MNLVRDTRFRVGVLVALACVTFWFFLPTPMQNKALMALAVFTGYYLAVPLALGLIVGWIALSWRAFWMTAIFSGLAIHSFILISSKLGGAVG